MGEVGHSKMTERVGPEAAKAMMGYKGNAVFKEMGERGQSTQSAEELKHFLEIVV